ncbi:MAG: glycosyltransferase, partial [Acidobacteria bacterium]
MDEQIIVFTRYPEPGRTKTRLIPALGPDGAAELQRQMTEHMLRQVRELASRRRLAIEIRYEGGRDGLMSQWLGADLSYRRQGEGDLGARLERAFDEAFQAGRHRVVIVGADCPGLTAALMAEAFDRLRQSDVVLGPARDGGYYLIGLRRPIPQLFEGISWGTARVLEETQEAIGRLGLSVQCLTMLDDVDRPEDLAVWNGEREKAAKSSPLPQISIIIPT